MSKLEKVISRRTDVDAAGSVNGKTINSAEKELELKFSNEYSNYLEKYGQISIEGHELTGLNCAKFLDVVEATKEEWELDESIRKDWYVIEQAGIDGIVLWQDANGTIFQSSPSSKPTKKADSLADYLSTMG